MENVEVRAAGQQILTVDGLNIGAGEHVAIVGSSGGGLVNNDGDVGHVRAIEHMLLARYPHLDAGVDFLCGAALNHDTVDYSTSVCLGLQQAGHDDRMELPDMASVELVAHEVKVCLRNKVTILAGPQSLARKSREVHEAGDDLGFLHTIVSQEHGKVAE